MKPQTLNNPTEITNAEIIIVQKNLPHEYSDFNKKKQELERLFKEGDAIEITDTPTYEEVQKRKMPIKNICVEIEKKRKLLNADAIKFQKENNEMAATLDEIFAPWRDTLQTKQDTYNNKQEEIKQAEIKKIQDEEKQKQLTINSRQQELNRLGAIFETNSRGDRYVLNGLYFYASFLLDDIEYHQAIKEFTEAKEQAEKDKRAAKEKANKINSRRNALNLIKGIQCNNGVFKIGDYNIPEDELPNFTDADFKDAYTKLTTEANRLQKIEDDRLAEINRKEFELREKQKEIEIKEAQLKERQFQARCASVPKAVLHGNDLYYEDNVVICGRDIDIFTDEAWERLAKDVNEQIEAAINLKEQARLQEIENAKAKALKDEADRQEAIKAEEDKKADKEQKIRLAKITTLIKEIEDMHFLKDSRMELNDYDVWIELKRRVTELT